MDVLCVPVHIAIDRKGSTPFMMVGVRHGMFWILARYEKAGNRLASPHWSSWMTAFVVALNIEVQLFP